MKKISIKINSQAIICDEGKTIMQAARDHGVYLPDLCFHPDLSVKANCRICVVEVKGHNKLATACSTFVQDGLEISTDSERVKRSRNLNLELIFAEHIEKCPTCVWRLNCKLLELADRYKIEITRFKDRKGKRKVYKFANAVEIDGTQCIDCRNCLDACKQMQKINFLKLTGKGADQEIVPVSAGWRRNGKIDCIYCGQCAVHCPVGAAQEQTQWQLVEKVLRDNPPKSPLYKGGKILVAQFAPSIRVSIGEEFGAPYGKIVAGQVAAALKKLGFNYVFDVNFGADITTIVETEELKQRLKAGGALPMFTACCPAWVKYAEFYRPDLIPNLTTARSPQMHAAGLVKTYWAEAMKIDPKNITVVSIMPCTAKKYEAGRAELKVNGLLPVDYVITTRELAFMIKKNKIDFLKLKPEAADNPLGAASGAAAIYGGTGGVMKAALRELGNRRLRTVTVNGIGGIEEVLANLNDYDYVEVMACPDGCIGGGGQPIPTTAAIRKKRLSALHKIDAKSEVRKAHENQAAVKALEWLEGKGKLKEQVLFTKYRRRS
ncbi:MAG: [Fe-Fe] hydrogenase large subunit C-terminal domain-containing protein [bacterium]|nr:[Fe-Fe] hydrogenase large subunit C-terminal domain-containing protein [bacterium]